MSFWLNDEHFGVMTYFWCHYMYVFWCHEERFGVIMCLWCHQDFFDFMTYSLHIFEVKNRVILTSWQTFWRHGGFWSHDELFDVMTCLWWHGVCLTSWWTLWRHDICLTFVWRNDVSLTSRQTCWRHDVFYRAVKWPITNNICEIRHSLNTYLIRYQSWIQCLHI